MKESGFGKFLAGRRAIVIGGSRGIGAAIVERLSTSGALVAFTYHGSERAAAQLAERLGAHGKVCALKADSAVERELSDAIAEAARTLGGLDVVIYNSGIMVRSPVDELATADLDLVYAVNVRGAFVAAKAALPYMSEGGRILFIGSNSTQRAAFPGLSAYTMSKSALVGLARGLALDLASRQITVNTLQPGPTISDMTPDDGPMAEVLRSLIPVGRLGESAEIAAMAAYLASAETGFLTGATITMDGGYSI